MGKSVAPGEETPESVDTSKPLGSHGAKPPNPARTWAGFPERVASPERHAGGGGGEDSRHADSSQADSSSAMKDHHTDRGHSIPFLNSNGKACLDLEADCSLSPFR